MGLIGSRTSETGQGRHQGEARPALEVAADGSDDSLVTRVIQRVLDYGLDGVGPFDSAVETAERARGATSSTDAAIAKVTRRHVAGGSLGGFATGIGGFVTMPVALPVNVVEFYVQATRMVGAIASLRGYDVREPRIRSAILLTLIGSHADDVLAKAGLTTGGGRMAALASKQLPPASLIIINKAVGFRLLRSVGEKALPKLGKGVPLIGGAVGAGLDGYLMKKIADHALVEFPARAA
jgi:hypothetical protein